MKNNPQKNKSKNLPVIVEISVERVALLRASEAASYLGVTESQLRLSRYTGELFKGVPCPTFQKMGRAIRYFKSDLDDWLENIPRYQNNAQVNSDIKRKEK